MAGSMTTRELLEISDLIVDWRPEGRRPVDKSAVVQRLRDVGDLRAARIVERLPDHQGVLDASHVDRLLVRVHCEMQRLAEEFQHGRRVCELLSPLLAAVERSGAPRPHRVVDVGCGTGYAVRWLAAHGCLTPDVEIVGVDFNRALIDEARRLAALEGLACRFEVADAFALDRPATVLFSTGVVHHFRGDSLLEFFRQHDRPGTWAFAHFDFQPSVLARPGAWLFHHVRMREPLSRHDGVVSARRAHSAATLLAAARESSFAHGMFGARIGPWRRVFHTVLGIRSAALSALRESLGARAGRLGEISCTPS